MRRHLSVPLALIAVLSFSGCKTSLFGGSEDANAKQAALEVEAKKAEAEKLAAAEKVAAVERIAAEEAAANREDPTADVEAPAFESSAEEDPRLVIFAERLIKADFGRLGREELLPDLLGGLDACKASMRTKLSFEKGYATMGRYEDAAAATACLDAYLKTPGAAKYAHLYLLDGAYMLEMHPYLEAKDMSAIRALFKPATGP